MKHIIKYQGILHESESNIDQKIEDIRSLFDLGMIDHAEMINTLIEISNRTGAPLESMLRPDDQYYKIDAAGYVEPENAEDIEHWLDLWRGPRGEKIVRATGQTAEDWFELDLTLSSGTGIHFEYNDRGDYLMTRSYAEVDGKRTHIKRDDYEKASDSYYSEFYNDFGQYMHDILNLLTTSSY